MPTPTWINSFLVFTKLFSITNSLMCFGRSFLTIKDPDIGHLRQQCHNSRCVIFQEILLKVLKCYNFLSATTTQLLSSGQFCKLRYDTIPVKSVSANVSFYTNNQKMPNFELWHSGHKWAICWADHLLPPSTEFKNTWNSTPWHPHSIIKHRDNFMIQNISSYT